MKRSIDSEKKPLKEYFREDFRGFVLIEYLYWIANREHFLVTSMIIKNFCSIFLNNKKKHFLVKKHLTVIISSTIFYDIWHI